MLPLSCQHSKIEQTENSATLLRYIREGTRKTAASESGEKGEFRGHDLPGKKLWSKTAVGTIDEVEKSRLQLTNCQSLSGGLFLKIF